MSGLSLDMGLGGSIFGGGYTGAATPAAAGVTAQGPTTIGAKAFGIVTGGDGMYRTGLYSAIGGGTIALGLLIFIWWSLPR